MTKTQQFTYPLFFFLFVYLAGMVSASAKELSRAELTDTFAGKTAYGLHIAKKLTLKDYFAKNGKFISARSNGEKIIGKWWVSANRAAICIRYKHKPKQRFCREIVTSSKGGYDRIRKKDSTILIHYDKIENGNKTK